MEYPATVIQSISSTNPPPSSHSDQPDHHNARPFAAHNSCSDRRLTTVVGTSFKKRLRIRVWHDNPVSYPVCCLGTDIYSRAA